MTCRVGLVDDHEIVSVALAGVIAGLPELEFAGVAPTVDELLTARDDLDVVVLDLRLADGSSPVNNVARLDAHGINVLAFTSGENPYLVRLVSQTAVLGVIRKSEPVAVLAEALERAADGRPVVSTDWAAALDSDPKLSEARLSPQEQNILALFAGGNKTQAVASQAGIAIGTVDDYVRRIRAKYAKIGRHAPSKVDLYKRAVEDGFLPPPGNE
jgi:two-component system response regulator DevR